MRMKLKMGIVVLFVLGINNSATCLADSPNDILIITNKGMKIDEVSLEELRQVFLKKKTTWQNGERIICINATDSSDIRAAFRARVLGMSANEESTYWEQQKVRKQLASPAEMRSIPKAVFKLKNAISYAYRKDVPNNVVKVLYVIPE